MNRAVNSAGARDIAHHDHPQSAMVGPAKRGSFITEAEIDELLARWRHNLDDLADEISP